MRALVLGAAASGLAAGRLLVGEGHAVDVYDRRAEARPSIEEIGAGYHLGDWDERFLDRVDLVVTSPGVPETADPIVDTLESGIRLIGEIELAASRLSIPLIAITGTNGKTTVTLLISEMLEASGLVAPAVGNIGRPLSDVVGSPMDLAVVETSSFQLRFIEAFHPAAAVITNVAPDHLDWHPTVQAYVDAKARLVENQTANDLVVFDAADAGAIDLAARSIARRAGVSGIERTEAGGVDDHDLWIGQLAIPLAELSVDDPAFLFDLAAAGVTAAAFGAKPEAITRVASNFVPTQHRRTTVGEWGGVRFVNDSKATNPHAALAAIKSFPSVVLIAGGLAKGLDIGPLARQPNLRAVIGIGDSRWTLVESATVPAETADDMEAAVKRAVELAEPGDTVLLAPGCASFDMFESYADRGDTFSRLVRAIMVGT